MLKRHLSFLIFMALCVAVFCALGSWQIKRLHWKEGLISQLDAAYSVDAGKRVITDEDLTALGENQFIRGELSGWFDFGKSFELQGQIDDGKQTSHLIVPVRTSREVTILADFGPGFKAPKTSLQARITGLVRQAPRPNRFTPDNVPDQKIWYSINPAQLEIAHLRPLVILPETTPWKTFKVQKPELRNAHLQYAIFWFTMAGLITILTAYFVARRK